MNKNVRLAKNTFWNQVRVSKGVKIREIAELFDVKESTAGFWFSGQQVPRTAIQCQLCDLFDIDYETGINNFTNDHKIWKNERGRLDFTTEEDLNSMKSKTQSTSSRAPSPIKYSNAWNIRRLDAKLSFKELATFLGLAESTVATFFSGRAIPSDNYIQMLCGLFNGLDFATGKQDFLDGHEMWVATQASNKTSKTTPPVTEIIAESKSLDDFDSIIEFVYGKVSRTDFLEFVDALSEHNCKALDIIYDKIPCADFITISKKFNDIKE